MTKSESQLGWPVRDTLWIHTLAILNSLSELLDIPTNPDARGTNGALADQDSSALLQVMDKNLFIKFLLSSWVDGGCRFPPYPAAAWIHNSTMQTSDVGGYHTWAAVIVISKVLNAAKRTYLERWKIEAHHKLKSYLRCVLIGAFNPSIPSITWFAVSTVSTY